MKAVFEIHVVYQLIFDGFLGVSIKLHTLLHTMTIVAMWFCITAVQCR